MAKILLLYFICPYCGKVIISESPRQITLNASRHVTMIHGQAMDVDKMVKVKEIELDETNK